ncbi:dCTP deaminase [Mycolicibacterium neoaurum]|uniref:dCTP deaminase n=1 Tax=Mycolicibacterium neoaurum TaxID=1795 RepID=UPI002671299B|nr:dCTP deaminase [Mycolicibacterium neoaurum]MDO3401371.1 dCTP deaminase [Mycolicibacterium neoaurum]
MTPSTKKSPRSPVGISGWRDRFNRPPCIAGCFARWLISEFDSVGRGRPCSNLLLCINRRRPRGSNVESEGSPLGNLSIIQRLVRPVGDSKRLVVSPIVDRAQIGTTTVDLRLGTEWEAMRAYRFDAVDPGAESAATNELLQASVEEFRLTAGQRRGLVLHPGELLLALTLEYLSLPDDLWGMLEGRSTWARQGLQVHAAAGMVDCGFSGYLTLELQNMGRIPLVLYPGLRVAQMAFFPICNDIAYSYKKKLGASYSAQHRARSAFTDQREHRARHAFMRTEIERETQRGLADREAVKKTPSTAVSAGRQEPTDNDANGGSAGLGAGQ